MLRFTITGGQPLNGTVAISGSKNAALPAMCAALLTDETIRLTNVPDIRDVQALAEILRSIGATVTQIDRHTWELSGATVNKTEIDYLLGRRLRASILLLGPVLARWGKITLPHPGGCVIGKRPVGPHFEALRGLGATVTHEEDFYYATAEKLTGSYLYLDEVSVTATENAIMAAALAEGETVIRPAAMEPHVVNLCELLVAMGAKIDGIGSHTVTVHGVAKLSGATHRIVSDEIETGTYAVAAAITGGKLTLTNVPDDLDPIIYRLNAMGVSTDWEGKDLIISVEDGLKSTQLQVDTWPRFPTDLQPQFGTLATQADGETQIHEWMYENRLKYTDSLELMGAQVAHNGVHEAIIHGPTPLYGAHIDSPDLRSGIAFVLAGLAATGETVVDHAELILRGYSELLEKMHAIGAKIVQTEVPDEDETEVKQEVMNVSPTHSN
jgi:UDP-N-acetylglucosamine 1-carboxyvinyltransferase